MSEPLVVALIALAGTLGSGALAYLASRRSTEVQLAAFKVEMERIRRSDVEQGRLERQQIYHDYLAAVAGMEEFMHGFDGPMTQRGFHDKMRAVIREASLVQLHGQQEVRDAGAAVLEVIADFSEACARAIEEEAKRSAPEVMRLAHKQTSHSWSVAHRQLMAAIKADVGHG